MHRLLGWQLLHRINHSYAQVLLHELQLYPPMKKYFSKQILFFGTWPLADGLNLQLKEILIKGKGTRTTDNDRPVQAEGMLIKNISLYGVNLWDVGWLNWLILQGQGLSETLYSYTFIYSLA